MNTIKNLFSGYNLLFGIKKGTLMLCRPDHQVEYGGEPEYYRVRESSKPCPDCGEGMIFMPNIAEQNGKIPVLNGNLDNTKGLFRLEDGNIPFGCFYPTCDCSKRKEEEEREKKLKAVRFGYFQKSVRDRIEQIIEERKSDEFKKKVEDTVRKELKEDNVDFDNDEQMF